MSKINLADAASHLVSAPEEDRPLTPEMEDIDKEMAKKFTEKVNILRSFLMLAENPADLADDKQRVVIFAKLSYGLRKSGEYLSWARFHHKNTKIDLKRSEALAVVDGVYDYVSKEKEKGREGKVTDKVRDNYKYLDVGVGKDMLREAMLEAMVEQLATMKLEFTMAISTIKAMAFGIKDENFMSSAAVAVSEDN